jgi:hypothetical protein
MLEMLSKVGGLKAQGDPVSQYMTQLMGLGVTQKPTGAFVQDALTRINTAAKDEGAAGKAAGGLWARSQQFWSKIPTPGKWALGGIGALLGLRILKSQLFGDEPAPAPGMRIPPEVAMRYAMGPDVSGSPLPPEPLGVQPGLHAGMGRPMVPFSPPPARVFSPKARSPRVTISGTETAGVSLRDLGDAFAQSVGTPRGAPLTGIYTSEYGGGTGKIDMQIEADMRAENRLYA